MNVLRRRSYCKKKTEEERGDLVFLRIIPASITIILMRQFLLFTWETLEMVIIAGVTVLVIRTFLAQPFLVSGASMSPNFSSGNYLIIDEITYRFNDPKRGDVIVFRYPNDLSTFYIKRIIGLPGDQVKIESGDIFINEQKIKEPYLNENNQTLGDVNLTLEDNRYFVMGDNRYHSFDSRSWGSLAGENIIGLTRLRLFPFGAIGILERPAYTK